MCCVGTALTLQIAETSISFPFQKEQAQQLSNSITTLIKTFAAKQKAERPRRWDMMEYKYKGVNVLRVIHMTGMIRSAVNHFISCRR